MVPKIILYDLDSKLPGKAWSPNVWKTRYCLNYKGIPYETKWIEFSDIQDTSRRLGAEPTEQRADGSWKYTVPTIHDPSTGKTISDSTEIAEYLDLQYPGTPKLFPEGSRALQTAYLTAYRAALPAIWQFAFPATVKILHPISAEAYDLIKYEEDGIPRYLSEEESRFQWGKMKSDFGKVDEWLKKTKENNPFILGDKPSYADFVFAGYITWLQLIWGEESDEWKDVSTWHNGRWGNLIKELEKYQEIQ